MEDVDDMTPLDALKVGLVQCLAMIPGTSRSGATIIGGMLLAFAQGGDRLLVLPRDPDADRRRRLQPLQGARAAVGGRPADVRVGLVFSFLSAWLCVRWLLRYISSHDFMPFAWYRIGFGRSLMTM